MVHKSVQLN